MEEITQSFNQVINDPLFVYIVGIIFSAGIFLGWYYDHKIVGFKKSMIILLPPFSLILAATFSRLYNSSLIAPLNASAYNGTITWILLLGFYVLGLFIGHMADLKGREKAKDIWNLI